MLDIEESITANITEYYEVLKRQQENQPETSSWSEKQRIDVSGEHRFIAPGPNDKRGPCPGLNAMANHGYLPRSGYVNALAAVPAYQQVFGMGIDMALVLSLYTLILSGDLLALSYSIGTGTGRSTGLLGITLFSGGQGLSGSHNKFETDASATRGDLYITKDADTLQMNRFKRLYGTQKDSANPNFDKPSIFEHRQWTIDDCIQSNPHCYFGPFSGFAVGNAGHLFIPALFSNYNKNNPNGRLSREDLKSWFSVEENPHTGEMKHKKGWERIPDNWYRRPYGLLNEYGFLHFTAELLEMAQVVPACLKIGGNTGTVNSFAGVDLGDLLGGVLKTGALLNPQKLTCYLMQTVLAATPDSLRGGLLGGILGNVLNVAVGLLNSLVKPLMDPSCPVLVFDKTMLEKFPGAKTS